MNRVTAASDTEIRLQKDFVLGQLEGTRLNLHLHGLIKSDGDIDINDLLPLDLAHKSMAYKHGLKRIIVDEVFPQAIGLFRKNARSTRERLAFMDEVLRRLR